MASKIVKINYGGQDRTFFRYNHRSILKYNLKMIGLVIIAMMVVSFVYCTFGFNTENNEGPMRIACLVYFGAFTFCHLLHEIILKKKIRNYYLYIVFIYELVFSFLLFVGPIYDSVNIACYLPVFFLASFLLMIAPMHFTVGLSLINIIISTIITYRFKAANLATFDLVDSATCLGIGIFLGQQILVSRISQIDSYNILQTESENELKIALELANKDPLTNVRSRAAYETFAHTTDELIKGNKEVDFALVMCDVNFLKNANDNVGHDAGDRLLINCARILQESFPQSNVYRLGGDEFIVVLRDDDYESRAKLFKQLRLKSLNKEEYDPKQVSFASGLATYNPDTDDSVASVFIRADEAMYENKNKIKSEKAS